MKPELFIKTFGSIAKDIEREYKIPAIFILAQGALESGWGAKCPGNMYFGVKVGNWQGRTQDIVTREYVKGKWITITDKFRAYNTPAESFRDHAQFLKGHPKFSRILNPYRKDQFIAWIKNKGFEAEAEKCGANRALCDSYRCAYIMQSEKYATAPDYFVTIASIISSLYALDKTLIPTLKDLQP